MKLLDYKGPYVYRATFTTAQLDQEMREARESFIENARYLALGDVVLVEPAEGGKRWVNDHAAGTKRLQHFVDGRWSDVPVFWVEG